MSNCWVSYRMRVACTNLNSNSALFFADFFIHIVSVKHSDIYCICMFWRSKGPRTLSSLLFLRHGRQSVLCNKFVKRSYRGWRSSIVYGLIAVIQLYICAYKETSSPSHAHPSNNVRFHLRTRFILWDYAGSLDCPRSRCRDAGREFMNILNKKMFVWGTRYERKLRAKYLAVDTWKTNGFKNISKSVIITRGTSQFWVCCITYWCFYKYASKYLPNASWHSIILNIGTAIFELQSDNSITLLQMFQ